jgi:hypothetical protein
MAAAEEALAILERIGSVEGLEQEILLVHARLCRGMGRHEEAERSFRRADEEVRRKAALIPAEERRRRFLERFAVGRELDLAGARESLEEPHGA